ncbi:hypothetical protein TNCT_404341 [Trichonephila clavata]|uniref:Uncharacterized protein n=1 Tax=Trichonephila clavata TaxID=2740835 RepID=A0A8X6LSX6_TRICU|nr:hypothetical protein TNCT_404341 [Trichonephila clavata]
MACADAGNEPRWRGEGENKLFMFPKYTDAHERSQGPLVVWKPVLLVKVLKIFMDSFKPLFVVWMDAFSAQKVSCCPGQVGHCIVE